MCIKQRGEWGHTESKCRWIEEVYILIGKNTRKQVLEAEKELPIKGRKKTFNVQSARSQMKKEFQGRGNQMCKIYAKNPP